MANFIKKLSLSEKRRQHYYNPWSMTDVIANFGGGKTVEQVREEQKEKKYFYTQKEIKELC